MALMKVIRISNMKKTITLLLLFSLVVVLSSCSLFKTEVVAYENEITLSYDSDLNGHLAYSNIDIPTYTIKFEGKLNITKQRTGEYECIFSNNDDFKVSKVIGEILAEYEEKGRVSYYKQSLEETNETWMNRRDEEVDEKAYIKVKDGIITNEIAYITLESGLQLTINYAKFVDSDTNITYYRWQKSQSIRIFLHYPLMVIDQDDERKFVFIAVPNQVRLKFDTTTKQIKDLLSKDKFTTSEWYTYDYQHNYNEDYDNYVKYYQDNFNGRIENEEFLFDYLGYTFKIDFNEENFVISFKK